MNFYGVAIGIVECSGFIQQSRWIVTDMLSFYGIHGNGKYHSYKQFCRGFKEDDIIIM